MSASEKCGFRVRLAGSGRERRTQHVFGVAVTAENADHCARAFEMTVAFVVEIAVARINIEAFAQHNGGMSCA